MKNICYVLSYPSTGINCTTKSFLDYNCELPPCKMNKPLDEYFLEPVRC